MIQAASTAVEFSRPVAADSIGPQRQVREISADAQERHQLAERFGLLALDRLDATLELRRHAGDVIQATGRLSADVVQSCVASLAPVPAHLEVEFEVSYSATAAESPEVELDPLAEDAPEPVVGGAIDLGEAVAQQLALSLDPYPRAPGAAWPSVEVAGPAAADPAPRHPFAGLAALKQGPAKKRSGKP
jgi:uncharacterized metal-binding protein YceD (DUF177 family)